MNMLAAAKETLELAVENGYDNISSDNSELDYPHLADMYNRMEEGINLGTFSEGKTGRWLGWMQAAVVAAGIGLNLDNMKQINMKWAD